MKRPIHVCHFCSTSYVPFVYCIPHEPTCMVVFRLHLECFMKKMGCISLTFRFKIVHKTRTFRTQKTPSAATFWSYMFMLVRGPCFSNDSLFLSLFGYQDLNRPVFFMLPILANTLLMDKSCTSRLRICLHNWLSVFRKFKCSFYNRNVLFRIAFFFELFIILFLLLVV